MHTTTSHTDSSHPSVASNRPITSRLSQEQRSSRIKNLLTVLIMVGVSVVTLVAIFIAVFLLPFEADMTAFANPELAHMRVPVLILVEILVGTFILICLLILFVLYLVMKNRIFSASSIMLMRVIAILFFSCLISCGILFIYTEINVPQAVTNLYVIFYSGLVFIFGCIFLLFGEIFSQAKNYKEENDLTV